MTQERNGARVGLHDLNRSWRYWGWNGNWIEVPRSKVHEDVAEQVVQEIELPYGRTAQGWMLEHGAVKQWDLYFISGSKAREVLKTIQDQLWRMMEEEQLEPSRLLMLSVGDKHAVVSVDNMLTARSLNDVITHRGPVRQNSSPEEAAFDRYPWHAWYYDGGWIPVPDTYIHAEIAEEFLKERNHEEYLRYVGRGWFADEQMIRLHAAIKQWGVAFEFQGTTAQLRLVQDRVVEMLGQGIRPETVFWLYVGDHSPIGLPAHELLASRNLREAGAGSVRGPVSLTPNASYLEEVKKVMEGSYGEATTDDPNESGFLLADGAWLKMGHGNRGDDHRVVTGYVRGKLLQEVYEGSRWNALVRWMKVTGSIRWMPESCSFDIFVKPTSAQIDRMWRMARRCEETTVEQTRGRKNETRVFSPPERDLMVEWIRAFWR